MKTIRIMAIAVLIVGSGLALLMARGQQAAGIKRTDRATAPSADESHDRRGFLTRDGTFRHCQAGSQLVVAARTDKRTPGSPGQGRRTRGSTQRVGDCHSVRERKRPRSTRNHGQSSANL